MQLLGDASDGFDILGYVIALKPIASGNSLDQLSVFVKQGYRQPVDFELTNVFHGINTEGFAHALIELQQFFFRIGIPKREHTAFVGHSFKFIEQTAAHGFGGTVWQGEFGELFFQCLQFFEFEIEFLV